VPARVIGHGILAAHDRRLMGQISEAGIVLELCPTSNLLTKALASEEGATRSAPSPSTACSSRSRGEMTRTHLRDEFQLLLSIGALEEEQLDEANRRGHMSSFVGERSQQT
jgi:adenosine deaminase